MTAAKISLKEGHTRGIMFSIGVCTVVFFQTYIAAIFARYLSKHPEIIDILQRVALVIFILITVYYLLIAKSERKQQAEPKIRSKHSRFFHGILLSAINASLHVSCTNKPCASSNQSGFSSFIILITSIPKSP